jgi:hypothetical protein
MAARGKLAAPALWPGVQVRIDYRVIQAQLTGEQEARSVTTATPAGQWAES